MKLKEIAKIIETAFPISTAFEWDNCGILLGDAEKEIKTVLLTLDVTCAVAKEAAKVGADLILSHHPILFDGAKKITADTADGRLVLDLAKSGIAVYAAHTNCDVGKNGINARLARLFELTNVEFLEESGLGRIGDLKTPVSFGDFAQLTKKILRTPSVRICGDKNAQISRVAVASGACADSIPTAVEKGANAIITADMKYHEMLNYSQMGISIIDAGHYPTEIIVTDIFSELLSDTGLSLIKSENPDIFEFI